MFFVKTNLVPDSERAADAAKRRWAIPVACHRGGTSRVVGSVGGDATRQEIDCFYKDVLEVYVSGFAFVQPPAFTNFL